MKTMSSSYLKKLFASSLIILAFAACKKDTTTPYTPPPPPPPPPPPITACKLVDETKNLVGNFEHYWYTYRPDGKLDSIYYSEVAGTGFVAYCKEDGDGFLWVTYKNTDGKTPDLFDYLYTGGSMQDSSAFPTSLATSFQLWDGINTPGYGYSFQYKANGKLDGYTQTAPFITGLLYGMGVEYDNNGNISTMVYNVITGPRAQSTVTATGYDGHPSPYTGLAGWVFLTPATGWTSSEYEPLFYALSPQNPTGSKINFGTDVYTDAMTYEYNAQGYPTKRTVIRTDPNGNPTTITHTYSYVCK